MRGKFSRRDEARRGEGSRRAGASHEIGDFGRTPLKFSHGVKNSLGVIQADRSDAG
jgi:hypothetical protein